MSVICLLRIVFPKMTLLKSTIFTLKDMNKCEVEENIINLQTNGMVLASTSHDSSPMMDGLQWTEMKKNGALLSTELGSLSLFYQKSSMKDLDKDLPKLIAVKLEKEFTVHLKSKKQKDTLRHLKSKEKSTKP